MENNEPEGTGVNPIVNSLLQVAEILTALRILCVELLGLLVVASSVIVLRLLLKMAIAILG